MCRNDKYLRRAGRVRIAAAFCADPVCDPLAVGREARAAATFRNQLFAAAGGGNGVDPAAVVFGSKRDEGAVGRNRGLAMVGFVHGETQGTALRHLLQPDVQIGASAVRGVRQQTAVRRESGVGGQSAIERYLHGRPARRRLSPTHQEPEGERQDEAQGCSRIYSRPVTAEGKTTANAPRVPYLPKIFDGQSPPCASL